MSADPSPQALRVAIVCPYALDVPGGVQAHVRELGAALRAGGDEVLVVAPTSDGGDVDAGVEARSVGRSLGVRFNRSVAPVAPSPLTVPRALRAIRAFGADVVHVHEPAVPPLALGTTLASRRPTVGTFHAWSTSDRLYRAARPLVRPAARRLAVRVAVSPPAARYHAGALGLAESDFTVVPNGVDVARFASADRDPGLAGDDPLILFVGRLEPRKGVTHLLDAYVALREDGRSLRLLVVGDGPGREEAPRRVPSRWREGVTFLGRVEPADLPRCHASADLLVAPSIGGESFGIVLVEAMAAGLPVVASDIPGYRAATEEGAAASLVPPGDPAALARAVDAVLADRGERGRLVDRGREVAARHDWSVVAGRVRGLYEEAVGER